MNLKVENEILEEGLYTIPDNWVWIKLKALKKNKKRNISPNKFVDETFQLYSVPSYPDKNPEILKGKDIGASKQLVYDNEVLLCKINPRINRVWKVLNDESDYRKLASTEWIVLGDNKLVDSNYLLYFLQSPEFRSLFTSNVSGVGGSLTRARPKDVENYPIALPPLEEQKRISVKIEKLLSEIDKAKRLIEDVEKSFELRRAAILSKAFRGELTMNWRTKNPLEKMIVQNGITEVPYELPDGWCWKKLNEVGQLKRGKSKHRPRNDSKLFGGKYPFIQTGDVARANDFIEGFSQTLSDFGYKQSELFPKGTVCITVAANIGDTAILKFPCCFPDSVVGFIPFNDTVTSEYFHYYISTIKRDLEHFAPATAQKNINLKILNDILIPIPPFEELNEVMNLVSFLLKREGEVKKSVAILSDIDTLKQTILSKAFKGELGTNDSKEENHIYSLEYKV